MYIIGCIYCLAFISIFSVLAMLSLESLLETEHLLIQTLEKIALELEEKKESIQREILRMRLENDKARTNPEGYLSIPTNAFALMRRGYTDWLRWHEYLKNKLNRESLNVLDNLLSDLPSSRDFAEAVNAMKRLQETYELKPADLAHGLINGKQYDAKLSSIDCYELGAELYARKAFRIAELWLQTALRIFGEHSENVVFDFNRLKVLDLYIKALRMQNKTLTALETVKSALLLQPNNARLLQMKGELEEHIKLKATQPINVKYSPIKPICRAPKSLQELYRCHCRGAYSNHVSKLYCIYNTTTTPFLKLAPLKMELLHLKPFMAIFHNVLSNHEIELLQTMARPTLKRSSVFNIKHSKQMVAQTRTSKFTVFQDNANDVTLRINRRIHDMTGLEINGSEVLQVLNYELGGHYDPHVDYFNNSLSAEIAANYGDRLATVLFYMSDVEQGGTTVFPYLKTTIYPQKGTALLWYNLDNRYEADSLALHGACPVLVGSKWVLNKWIRERNQIFKKPCYES